MRVLQTKPAVPRDATDAPQPSRRATAPSGRRTRLGLGVVLAACVGTLGGWGGAVAATPLTDYSTNLTRVEAPNPHENGRWASRLRTVPDLTGDGKNDILVGAYRESFGGFSVAGRMYMQDGATRDILYMIDAPQIQSDAEFGFFPAVLGDVDGDGKADFVSGARGQDTLADGTRCTPPSTGPVGDCHQDQGKAWVFSGANGRTLYELNNPNPQGFGNFGITGRAGDINGDGVADILVGAYANDVPAGCGLGPDGRRLPAASLPAGCRADQGEAFIFSGKPSDHANGASGLLRTLSLPASDQMPAPCGGFGAGSVSCGTFGLSPQGVGDLTGDGVFDQYINALSFNFDTASEGACADPSSATCIRGQGAVYLFNGATGALIRRTDDPVPQAGVQWGAQDAEPLGDVNGDGVADYYVNAPLQAGPSGEPGAGRSWVFSGASGTVLYEVKDPTPSEGGAFGFSMTKTDYNHDGAPDLYVGQNPHHRTGATIDTSGGTYVFDGRDGSLLKSLELPPSDAQPGADGNLGSLLGWTVVAPGDLNGDGEPDFVAGAPTTDVGPTAFNCQAPIVGCVKDVGRQYFFLSHVPTPPVAPGPAGPVPVPAPGESRVDPFTAKLSLARATINRRDRVLDVLAPITSRASGRARVQLHAAGRRFRFTAPVDSNDGRIRFRQRIPQAQADLGTGIVTITYRGDADTRPQTVRLRAASQQAKLRLSRPTISDGRLRAQGSVSEQARGVVRVQIEYVLAGQTSTLQFKAPIRNGRWSLNEPLSQTVRTAIAQRTGTVHSYTLFTGYYPRRVRGEMRSFQILRAR